MFGQSEKTVVQKKGISGQLARPHFFARLSTQGKKSCEVAGEESARERY